MTVSKQIPQVSRNLKWLHQAYGERKRVIEKVLEGLSSEERRELVIRLSNNLLDDLGPIIEAINAGQYDVGWPEEHAKEV